MQKKKKLSTCLAAFDKLNIIFQLLFSSSAITQCFPNMSVYLNSNYHLNDISKFDKDGKKYK